MTLPAPSRYTAAHARAFFSGLAGLDPILALFDHLPRVYFFVKDRRLRVVKANRGWLLMHGLKEEKEALGWRVQDFHPPAMAAQYDEEDRRVMASRQVLPDRISLVRGADGMPRWYLVTKIPLHDRKGSCIGLAGVMRPYDHAGDAPGEHRRLTAALEHVLTHYDRPLRVETLAGLAHLSVSQLQRVFQRLYGMTPSDYVLRVRLLMARQKLEQTRDPAGRIALDCGFYDQSHFNRAFVAATGLRPLEYRRRFAPRSPRE